MLLIDKLLGAFGLERLELCACATAGREVSSQDGSGDVAEIGWRTCSVFCTAQRTFGSWEALSTVLQSDICRSFELAYHLRARWEIGALPRMTQTRFEEPTR